MTSGLKDFISFSKTLCKTTGWTSIVLSTLAPDKSSVMLLEPFLFPRLAFYGGYLRWIGDCVELWRVPPRYTPWGTVRFDEGSMMAHYLAEIKIFGLKMSFWTMHRVRRNTLRSRPTIITPLNLLEHQYTCAQLRQYNSFPRIRRPDKLVTVTVNVQYFSPQFFSLENIIWM